MFKKIHSIFHPNSQRRNVTDDIPYCDGAGSAVRLIRSTSMYVLGGEQEKVSEPLKKCRSTTSIDSCFQPKEEDRDWMYSKTQDCLKYLQDLLALRKKYLENINNLKSMHMAADSPASTRSSKTGKKSFLPLPSKEPSKVISKNFWHVLSLKHQKSLELCHLYWFSNLLLSVGCYFTVTSIEMLLNILRFFLSTVKFGMNDWPWKEMHMSMFGGGGGGGVEREKVGKRKSCERMENILWKSKLWYTT